MKSTRSGALILAALGLLTMPGGAFAQVVLLNAGHTNNDAAVRSYATSLVVVSNYVYLANTGDGLRVYDLSNPSHPANVGHVVDPNPLNSIAVSDDRLYAVAGLGFSILDI